MQIIDFLKHDEKQRQQASQARQERALAKALLQKLVQPEQYVGDVYSLGYESASVQIHDFHRRKVGGIPSLCFLVASREVKLTDDFDYQREDSSVILLCQGRW